MNFRPVQIKFENRLGSATNLLSATNLYGTVALSFVLPSVPGFPTSPLLPATAYVVLPRENHMQLIEAAILDRKSGGAERLSELSSGHSWKRRQLAASENAERFPLSHERGDGGAYQGCSSRVVCANLSRTSRALALRRVSSL